MVDSAPDITFSGSSTSSLKHLSLLRYGTEWKFFWENLFPGPSTQGYILQRTTVPMGALDTVVMSMMPWPWGKPLNFPWVPAQFQWDWDTPLQPASHITHSLTGRWKGVYYHSVFMCFGMQAHFKSKGQSTPLRNEASNFAESLLMGGCETVKMQNPERIPSTQFSLPASIA